MGSSQDKTGTTSISQANTKIVRTKLMPGRNRHSTSQIEQTISCFGCQVPEETQNAAAKRDASNSGATYNCIIGVEFHSR